MRAEERDRGVCRRIGKCNKNAVKGKKEEKVKRRERKNADERLERRREERE